MEIFQADIKAIPGILEVAEATWKQTYRGIISDEQIGYMYERMYTPEILAEQIQIGVAFLVAAEDGQPIGFAGYEFRQEAPADPNGQTIHCIYVPKLYVRPEWQRKNIGKKLLAEIERIGGEKNCHFVELNVNRNNPALQFYEKLGFFIHQTVDIPYDQFWLNDYVMRKSIQFVAP